MHVPARYEYGHICVGTVIEREREIERESISNLFLILHTIPYQIILRVSKDRLVGNIDSSNLSAQNRTQSAESQRNLEKRQKLVTPHSIQVVSGYT